jgi:hypothetical protein
VYSNKIKKSSLKNIDLAPEIVHAEHVGPAYISPYGNGIIGLRGKIFLITAVAVAAAMTGAGSAARQNFPSFIGIKACAKCHEAEGIGDQVKVWASSPHAKSFQLLQTERALAIGKKSGVDAPPESLACLKCHTTGGGRTEATRSEGVGCEACHGPGSLYNEFSNHASFENRENAYMRAVSLGMYPILGIKGIKAREKLCRYCHNEERPCLPDSPEEKKRQKLPLSLIADFVFKHPVRR